MTHEDKNPAAMIAEHLADCTDARAAIVVDGDAGDIIESLTAAGWGQAGRTEYIGGKRIRYLTIPVTNEEAQP